MHNKILRDERTSCLLSLIIIIFHESKIFVRTRPAPFPNRTLLKTNNNHNKNYKPTW